MCHFSPSVMSDVGIRWKCQKRGDDLIRTKSCHLKVFTLGCRRRLQNVNSEVLRGCVIMGEKKKSERNVSQSLLKFVATAWMMKGLKRESREGNGVKRCATNSPRHHRKTVRKDVLLEQQTHLCK